MNDVTSPLGMLKGKPLSYFNALTKGHLQDPQKLQVSLGQVLQNFVVTIGPSTKIRILHNLFSVNTDPDTDALSTIVGIHGVNKVAPFKTITAAGAVQALVPPRRVGSKKDQDLRLPSSIQFVIVESADQFRDLVRDEDAALTSSIPKSS
jgi:hypothetical protein